MASTILSDNGVSSGSAGIKTTADSTGSLALQTTTAGGAATTAVTIDTSQNVGIGATPITKLDVTTGDGGANSSAFYVRGTTGVFGLYPYLDASLGCLINSYNAAISAYKPMTFQASSFAWLPNGTERMRIDSSGNVGIGTTSPAYKLDIQGTLGTTGAITPNQTAGIVGTTTNNNANAGSIGEVVSSSVAVGSAVSITTATSATSGKTVTSISLTAGDWDIFGTIGINLAAGTKFTVIGGGINTVTNELNALYEEQLLINYGAGGLVPLNTQTYQIPTTRVSIASTTTYYLIAYAQFTVNTATGYGRITARRRR